MVLVQNGRWHLPDRTPNVQLLEGLAGFIHFAENFFSEPNIDWDDLRAKRLEKPGKSRGRRGFLSRGAA
jgi:hypothetical protein